MIRKVADVAAARAGIVEEALSWVGTPFHHRAGLKGVGTDCAHLLKGVFVARSLIEDFIVPDYKPDWFLHRDDPVFLKIVARYAHQVEKPEPGDVAMFNFGRHAAHGAILLDHYTMVHAYAAAGEVRRDSRAHHQHRLDSYWSVFP